MLIEFLLEPYATTSQIIYETIICETTISAMSFFFFFSIFSLSSLLASLSPYLHTCRVQLLAQQENEG